MEGVEKINLNTLDLDTDTRATDGHGLSEATGGVDETSFNSADLPDTPYEENAKILREEIEQENRSKRTREEIIEMGTPQYKKVEELKALFKENGYTLESNFRKFNFELNFSNKINSLQYVTKRGKLIEFINQRNKNFRTFNAILNDLRGDARS